MKPSSRQRRVALLILFAVLVLVPAVAVARLTAAPRKGPAANADEVIGEYKVGSKAGPIVAVTREPDLDPDIWLVFAPGTESAEAFARTLKAGDRVKARGRLAQGGEYRYLIVADIARDE